LLSRVLNLPKGEKVGKQIKQFLAFIFHLIRLNIKRANYVKANNLICSSTNLQLAPSVKRRRISPFFPS